MFEVIRYVSKGMHGGNRAYLEYNVDTYVSQLFETDTNIVKARYATRCVADVLYYNIRDGVGRTSFSKHYDLNMIRGWLELYGHIDKEYTSFVRGCLEWIESHG